LNPEAPKSAPANCCFATPQGWPGQIRSSKHESRNNRGCDRGNPKSEARISKQIRITEGENDQNGKALRFEIPLLNIPSLFRNSDFDIRNFGSMPTTTVAVRQPGFVPAFLFSA
jgi:hypothetical protein